MTYVDADALAQWEKGEFDLIGWAAARPDEVLAFPAVVWQQITYGLFAFQPDRAAKRARSLLILGHLDVAPFERRHAVRAAELTHELRLNMIGFADTQIAAMALVDGAELLTFNDKHFNRVPGIRLATK